MNAFAMNPKKPLSLAFDPSQPRNDAGEWTAGAASAHAERQTERVNGMAAKLHKGSSGDDILAVAKAHEDAAAAHHAALKDKTTDDEHRSEHRSTKAWHLKQAKAIRDAHAKTEKVRADIAAIHAKYHPTEKAQ